jgi:hypothetical protein
MVVGYWDGHEYGSLVPGDAFTQTAAVDEMIATEGPASNYTDYCEPLDYSGPILPDLSEPPDGDEHDDNCVADFMFTSQSASDLNYGSSWLHDEGPAVQAYAAWVDPRYSVNTQLLIMGRDLDWDSYRAEIDAGRPLALFVDTAGFGVGDHLVTAFGYDVVDSEKRYACHNTWDYDVHWYEFAPVALGQPWGVHAAITFEFSGAAGPVVHEAYVVDDDMLGDSIGNGNGIVECGETIELWVDLRNQGTGTAVGVQAEIGTSDPYASIVDNHGSSYAPIDAGGTGRNEEDFEISVYNATPNGHVIHFDYDLTATYDGPWSAPFSIPVVCPIQDILVTPGSLQVTVPPGQSTARTLTIANLGRAPLEFEISEEDTTSVVAPRDIGTGQAVLVGGDHSVYADDAARTVVNAAQWAGASADVPWLSEDPISGTVSAEGSLEVMVTFDSAGLSLGTYRANLNIANNDPDENPVIVPVKLLVDHPPQVGTADPPSGSGPVGVTTYFTTTWTDADGWQDLKQCYFHIGDSPSIVGNVTLMYNNVKSKLWLRSDDGSAWTGGFAPGSANTLENSQAVVRCNLSTAGGSGDTLSVRWAIEFKAGFSGAKKTGLKCKDIHKAKAKGRWKGTWTVE